jgi:hypothetical protein
VKSVFVKQNKGTRLESNECLIYLQLQREYMFSQRIATASEPSSTVLSGDRLDPSDNVVHQVLRGEFVAMGPEESVDFGEGALYWGVVWRVCRTKQTDVATFHNGISHSLRSVGGKIVHH